MNSTMASRFAAALGFLAVVLGALGAHGLTGVLSRNGTTAVWQTAAFYHFIHAVMLFVLAQRPHLPAVAWWSFFIGIFIFSGSLYLLAATNVLWIGAVTPVGGLCFLFGWGSLVFEPKQRK